ncbi:transcriptional regulator, TetR family [Ruminococcus sp. YE71]|uniref:TetR/AcrR family transcriptional regulator n=1 Tax=unclassified Ruminococcus TaxID=2608920 RepID=UPI000890DB4F|nr:MULTISPECIES: TetR/AcrR family transcriptional regulator [unclassified Ruminococcus]SDA22954.1 transcriptional regulator, TetR family [Ruminococcus sp. YE78]SFW39026.1 transcriptional regulator, TetR family [Ruminococcus sp. YE71]
MSNDKREQIILATLELAAENGLGGVSMSQIADRLGIRKPSLYNHFKSKEEIISAMYHFLRERSRSQVSAAAVDLGELVRDRSAEEVLSFTVANYNRLNEQPEMMSFYKVIYSQRSLDPIAAQIMAEETEKMLLATKNLFYALKAHGKITVEDVDTAAESFAMTIHAMTEYQLDCVNSGKEPKKDMLGAYIKWFAEQIGGNNG